jgi:XTP/dITP diphosphohydrolase
MTTKKRFVLATQNVGKIQELERILEKTDLAIEVLGLRDFPDMPDVEETGTTFAENSLLKSRAIAAFTGLPALADDSGLCVDALGGDPGIFSARWAGKHGDDEANIVKVLEQLHGESKRTARFVCAVSLVFPANHIHHHEEIVVEGVMTGEITQAPIGSFGFGYDPIFRPDGYQLTSGQLDPVIKDEISHRGQALRKILPFIEQLI